MWRVSDITGVPFEEPLTIHNAMCRLGYWILSYPIDVVKSAIQTDSIWPEKRKYKGVLDTAQKLWAEGGVKRYTAGIVPCLLRSFPANAAGFAAYETVKTALEPPQALQ
jgi:solute carrier family 25 carnitine/acylcarnitine transporter 20/29